MNKEQFYDCLNNSQQLTAEILGQLNGIVNDFPYCQSARLLLTATLYKENDIRYEKELATTAIYAGNRGVLRRYIHQKNEKHTAAQIILPDEHADAEIKQKTESSGNTESGAEKPDGIAELRKIVEERIVEIEAKEKEKTYDHSDKTLPDKTKTDLIDEFIKNEPSITRQKGSFFNPVTAAKQSITDQENIISETLAQIYMDQGFVDKAISTYNKLSLKYPEKSAYFAALIEKAEKKRES
ncbi:MAG: hypothetical protein KQH67_08535 [Bacteroidetes bacterium]|nr:hypothetical protein [Bacteroidota bacterium]